jgi:hypothetical protein
MGLTKQKGRQIYREFLLTPPALWSGQEGKAIFAPKRFSQQ